MVIVGETLLRRESERRSASVSAIGPLKRFARYPRWTCPAILPTMQLPLVINQASAVANIKVHSVSEGFAAFDLAVEAARRHGESLMLAKILNNYSAAAIQDGSSEKAILYAKAALERFRAAESSVPFGLITLAEALYAAGRLREGANDATKEKSVRHLMQT